MTCIVSPTVFPSKKALKEHLAAGANVNIYDPTIFNERRFTARDMAVGEVVVVTNHPKRSWYAQIKRTEDGFKVT